MLEDYRHTRLEMTESEKSEIQSQIRELCDEESRERVHIEQLTEENDNEICLFSPRRGHNKKDMQANHDLINEILKHIDEIGYKKAELALRLTHIDMNETKWKPEGEAHRNSLSNLTIEDEFGVIEPLEQPDVENTSENLKKFPASRDMDMEQFEQILDRIDKCIRLSHSDHVNCGKELKELRHYVKDLITSKNQ